MSLLLEVKKGQRYECIKNLPVPSGYGTALHEGGVYACPEDGYIIGDNGYRFKPYPYTLLKYLKPADLIKYIKKSHIKAVEKFNEELKAWEKETEEYPATLYEDAYTSFTLSDIAISNDGQLFYTYDGQVESEVIVRQDEETGEYWEDDGIDGIMEYVKFWRKCLRRAKRYWSMDTEKLDAIQNGDAEDEEEEEE